VVVESMAGKADGALVARAGVDRTGNERGESRPVSAVDRQLVHLLLFDWRTDRGVDAVQLKIGLGDADVLPALGDAQCDVQGSGLPDFQFDAAKTQFCEASLRDLDAEYPRLHVWQNVTAQGVRLRFAPQTGRRVDHLHPSRGNPFALFVGDSSV